MANKSVCAVQGCDNTKHRRIWCAAHYARWQRHGDPEAGGAMHGDPYRFFCEEVLTYSGDDCLIWPYGRAVSGYGQISIEGVARRVSRLVCAEIHGPPPTPGHEAAHSCGRGAHGCVAKHHLRWATRTENEGDKSIHGTRYRGERHFWAKLSESDVRLIRGMQGTATQRDIATQFGISKTLVGDIHRGERWGWLV